MKKIMCLTLVVAGITAISGGAVGTTEADAKLINKSYEWVTAADFYHTGDEGLEEEEAGLSSGDAYFQYTDSRGVVYSKDYDEKKAKIEGYRKSYNKNIIIPKQITVKGRKYSIEEPEIGAFPDNCLSVDISRCTSWKDTGFMFCDLQKLKSVKLPSSIKYIGQSSFSDCKSLKKLEIGSNVTGVDTGAFWNCKKLKTITIKSKKLKKSDMGKNIFKGTSQKITIKVPKSKVKEYSKLFKNQGNKNVVVKQM